MHFTALAQIQAILLTLSVNGLLNHQNIVVQECAGYQLVAVVILSAVQGFAVLILAVAEQSVMEVALLDRLALMTVQNAHASLTALERIAAVMVAEELAVHMAETVLLVKIA
jgi:hypothetical protein